MGDSICLDGDQSNDCVLLLTDDHKIGFWRGQWYRINRLDAHSDGTFGFIQGWMRDPFANDPDYQPLPTPDHQPGHCT